MSLCPCAAVLKRPPGSRGGPCIESKDGGRGCSGPAALYCCRGGKATKNPFYRLARPGLVTVLDISGAGGIKTPQIVA